MSRKIVSYDLSQPHRNYKALFEELDKFPNWSRPLESVWILDTDLTTEQIVDRLRRVLDSDDKLFVAEMTSSWTSWNIHATVVKWLGGVLK